MKDVSLDFKNIGKIFCYKNYDMVNKISVANWVTFCENLWFLCQLKLMNYIYIYIYPQNYLDVFRIMVALEHWLYFVVLITGKLVLFWY